MAVTTKQFIDRWSKEMRRAEQHDRGSYWEAEEAIKELGESRSLRREILKDLLREAQVYERLRLQIAESNRAFKSAMLLVATLRRKASRTAAAIKQKSGPACELISRHLVDIITQMERCSNKLEETRSNFWQIQLRPYPLKGDNPQEVWIALPTSGEEWTHRGMSATRGRSQRGLLEPRSCLTQPLSQREQLTSTTVFSCASLPSWISSFSFQSSPWKRAPGWLCSFTYALGSQKYAKENFGFRPTERN